MGGIALLARERGIRITGSDANVYPPMSTQLEEQGIALGEGYDAAHLPPAPDCVIVGNALSRGNAAVEYVLNEGLPYTSGPQWLAEHVLPERWVLAIAGTHGKSTTASMLAWVSRFPLVLLRVTENTRAATAKNPTEKIAMAISASISM